VIQRKVDFNKLEWESPLPGIKQKFLIQNDLKLRLVEYTPDMPLHWCEKGHYGLLLEGKMEVEYVDEKIIYKSGDGFFIPDAEAHRHQARVLSEKALVFFVERV
jgi:quercetin dioxygenase-like cupin family protein